MNAMPQRPRMTVVAGGSPPPGDDRVDVMIQRGRTDQVADAAERALLDAQAPFYARGDVLVRVARDLSTRRDRRTPNDNALPSLVPATAPMLQDALEACCRFRVVKSDGEAVTTGCPRDVPGVILSRIGRWLAPQVRGVAAVPVLHDDGSIAGAGYDATSQHVIVLDGEWPRVPDTPDEADARAALGRVDELIGGFPFAGDADRAVTIAAFLSAVLRPTLPTCPGFAWSAPVRGSGKSKLADVTAVFATGRPAAVMNWPVQAEEQEKRLGAALLAGDPIIAIDNIEGQLRGDALNSMLTQSEMAIRVLGVSRLPRVAVSCVLTVTGNNLVVAGDMTRRMLVAHLDPRMERPELRRFDFEPVSRAKTQRRDLVVALLTIARWWCRSGIKGDLPPLGSFEVWSRRVRDPLVALGLADPCGVLDELHKEDPEREAAQEVLTEWNASFGESPTSVADAIRRATSVGGDSALRDALDAVAGSPGGIVSKRLGRWLLKHKDRILGGLVLRREHDAKANVAVWSVRQVAPSGRVSGLAGFVSPLTRESSSRIAIETNPVNPITRGEEDGVWVGDVGGDACLDD